MTAELHEKRDSAWWLAAAPAVWAAHFMLSYATVAIWCSKRGDASFTPARVAIGVYTIVALAALAALGVRGWSAHRYGDSKLPHDDDTPEDRHRFLGLATFLLATLAAVAVFYQALSPLLIRSCR